MDVDAIVIGSGPNGLVAANVLADAGWSVAVLEASDSPGGAVRSGRLRLAGTMDFARFAALPLRRMVAELRLSPLAARLIAGNALHADISPEAPGSGMFGWLLVGLARGVGFPVPEGGAGQLTAALVSRLEANGGRVVCGTAVERIEVRNGRAIGVRTLAGDVVSAHRAV